MGQLSPWETAQRAVIGSLLIDPEHCAGMIFSRTTAKHYGSAPLRHVFEAAQALYLDQKPVDAVTVLAAAGEEYRTLLADCMREVPTASNLDAYLDIVRSSARLASMQAAAMEIINARSEADAIAIYERMGQGMAGHDGIEDLSWTECVNRYLDRVNDRTPPDYLHWGIKPLDKSLTVGRGKFVVLGADSSAGKTALALQFAYHMATTGRRVLFVSLETDNDTLTNRLMAEEQVAGIALPRSLAHALSCKDYERAIDVGSGSSQLYLRMINRADTVESIRRLVIQHRADVVFVDYLQLIAGRGDTRWDIVTRISMELHRMAQQTGCTVVALSQITPQSKSGDIPLTMDDLRESRQIKHDADVILLMSGYKGFPKARRLTIAKNKDGKRALNIRLWFDAQHMTFTEATDEQIKEMTTKTLLHELPDPEPGEIPF